MRKACVAASLGYLALFAFFTFPLMLHPNDTIVANHGDGFVDMTLFWYARTGQLWQPHVNSLFYPFGVPLAQDKGFLLVPLMSVPLQWFGSIPLAFNILCALFFTATGVAMFVLARGVGAGNAGAFVAGALLVLSPSYLEELLQGIPETMGLQWLLLFVYVGLRARGQSGWRWPVLMVGLFILNWYQSWYCGCFALLFLGMLAISTAWRGGSAVDADARPWRWGWVIAVAIVLLVWSVVGWGSSHSRRPTFDTALAQAFLSGKAVPADPDRVFGVGPAAANLATCQILMASADFGGMLARYRPSYFRDALPGWLLLGLAVVGATRMRRAALPWLCMTAVFVAVAVGPLLFWNGSLVTVLPTSWAYEHIAVLSLLRPVRFLLPATICLAVLAGRAVPTLRSAWLGSGVALLLVGLQAVEVLVIQIGHYHASLASAVVPAYYQRLAEDAGGALIEVPLTPIEVSVGRHLFYQSVHHHPLLNYDFIRTERVERLAQFGRDNPIIGWFLGQQEAARPQDAEQLRQLGFRAAILHARLNEERFKAVREMRFSADLFDNLRSVYGEPRDEGDGLLVFDLAHPSSAVPRGETIWLNTPSDLDSRINVPPDAPPVREIRYWVRGAGARLSIWGADGPLVTSRHLTDDWAWIRLKLPTPLPPSTPFRLRIDPPADGGEVILWEGAAWCAR